MRPNTTLPTLREILRSLVGRALVLLVCGLLVAVDVPLAAQTAPAAPAADADKDDPPLTAD